MYRTFQEHMPDARARQEGNQLAELAEVGLLTATGARSVGHCWHLLQAPATESD